MVGYGNRIKAAREAAHMTQEELGHKVGMTGVAIMRYEKEQREPSLQVIEDLASVLDVSISYLLGQSRDPLSPSLQCAFWEILKKRIDGELMQYDLADIEEGLGTDSPYDDVFEHPVQLTLERIEEIADELGVPLEYLIAGENNPHDHYPLDDEELESSIDLAESKLIETVHLICGMDISGANFSKGAWNPTKIDIIREYLKDSWSILKKMFAAAGLNERGQD